MVVFEICHFEENTNFCRWWSPSSLVNCGKWSNIPPTCLDFALSKNVDFHPFEEKNTSFFSVPRRFYLNQMGWCHTDPSMREIHTALQNQSCKGLEEFGSLGIEGFEHLWDVQRQFSFMFLFHSDINKDDVFRDVLYCIVYCIASFFPPASHKFESNDNVVSEIRLREAFICGIKHCKVGAPFRERTVEWGAYHPLDTNSLGFANLKKTAGKTRRFQKGQVPDGCSEYDRLLESDNSAGQKRWGVFLEIFPDDFFLVS